MLLAEEFVLISLDPSGSLARASTFQWVSLGVTGALVVELVIGDHLDVADGRIRLTGTRPTHPLLDQALQNVGAHEGKKLRRRLGSIRHAGWREVVDGMIAAGVLGREKQAMWPTRHPVTHPAAHAALLAEVRDAALGTNVVDERTATLLALAASCGLIKVIAPARSDRKMIKDGAFHTAVQLPDGVRTAIRQVQISIDDARAAQG